MTEHSSGRFAVVPARALDDPDLDHEALAVLAAISTYEGRHGWCAPPAALLAERLGQTVKAIAHQIDTLEMLNYIDIRRDPNGGPPWLRLIHEPDRRQTGRAA